MTASPPSRGGGSVAASGLVVLGLACQEVGASVAVLLFPTAGALGTVTLRLVFSALFLVAIFRPRWRGRSRADWGVVAGFGLVLAGMNVMFYEALARLPLGAAVTIEVVGPLILSVVMGRRLASWLWAVLAFVGVALLGAGGVTGLDPVGVLFAAGAGAAWAGYILLSARTGSRFERLDGLAIAMVIGSLATLPFGIAATGSVLFSPTVLLLGAAIAVLSSAIPYAAELIALRRVTESAFAILMSLAPAVAALAGLLVLGQQLTLVQYIAIGLVIVASAGAVRTSNRQARQPGDIVPPTP
ncbi:EamA family transporter [Marisediminicola sp. LYQ134]|uniref:EamA family transporter n=1 Tax=unclassified Marisediminicola TaxID=2618316 RepID=UPI0039837451